MPNHVHVLFVPDPGHRLADIIHTWKRHTSRQINTRTEDSGRLWQPDCWDAEIGMDLSIAIATLTSFYNLTENYRIAVESYRAIERAKHEAELVSGGKTNRRTRCTLTTTPCVRPISPPPS